MYIGKNTEGVHGHRKIGNPQARSTSFAMTAWLSLCEHFANYQAYIRLGYWM